MRQRQIYTSWMITCPSPEQSQALQRWLANGIALDRVLTDTVRTFPSGVEQVRSVPHRLGDYFADIRLLPAPTPAAFRLVFHRRSGADRFWKDLMVNIMQEIEATPEKPSISLNYKGDQEACAVGGTPGGMGSGQGNRA